MTANAFYPGLVGSRLERNLPWPLLKANCPTSVYLASSPSVPGTSGQFFAYSRPVDLGAHAMNLDAARLLWEASERLTRGEVDHTRTALTQLRRSPSPPLERSAKAN